MSLQIEATYENGVLRLDRPLPLQNHERVLVTIQPQTSRANRSYGLIGWTGDAEVLRKIAEDDDFGVQEAP